MFSLQKFVVLYPYLPRMANSAQQPLDGNNNINFIIN